MKDLLHVRIESPALPGDSVEIHTFSGREAISQLFEYELLIVVRGTTELDEEALLTSVAELVFEKGGAEVARMFGMIASVKDSLQSETQHLAYTLVFVPRLWRMSLTETSEIFMDQSVVDIVEEKLTRSGLVAEQDFEIRLRASYPPQEFVVQYKETDLAFLSRLTEHHGIAFFFEHKGGKDVLVLTDENSGFLPIAGDTVPFSPRGERLGVFALERTTRSLPSRYVVKDYNYRTPQVSLTATAPVSNVGGDIVEYGAHFKTPGEASRAAKIRSEELLVRRTVFDGKSDVQTLRAGVRFKLDGHSRADGEYLLVEVRHHAQQVALGMGAGEDAGYTNEFVAIPAKTTFRPARVTAKPKVHGVINGTIETEAKGQYADVDGEGRYRVRFQFDTGDAQHGKASRPIRMAQPHAGAGYGFHFPLRDGVEVLLTFIDGDPDRPIISGAVPNPVTPSTVGAENGRRNVIRTGGGNEINIDDTEGSERIKMTTPYGNTLFQLGAPNAPVPGAFLKTGFNAYIEAGEKISIAAQQKVTIIGDENIDVGSPFIDIVAVTKLRAGAEFIEVNGGNSINASAPWIDISGTAKIRAGAPVVEINAGNSAHVNGTFVDINGTAKIRAGSALVEVNGATVLINGSGAISIKGGAVSIEGSTVNIKGGSVNLNC